MCALNASIYHNTGCQFFFISTLCLNDFTNKSTAHTLIHRQKLKQYNINNIYYVLTQSSPDQFKDKTTIFIM